MTAGGFWALNPLNDRSEPAVEGGRAWRVFRSICTHGSRAREPARLLPSELASNSAPKDGLEDSLGRLENFLERLDHRRRIEAIDEAMVEGG